MTYVKEVFVSVDVEADGKIPGEFSMVSLGAVIAGTYDSNHVVTKFDLDDPANCFRYDFKPISDNWDAEALAISGFDRQYFIDNGREPAEAMTEFANGISNAAKEHGTFDAPIFAGFPLGFDWMFTYWYLVKFSEIGSPFGFSRHLDIKTEFSSQFETMASRASKRNMPKYLRSTRPHTHDPLDDAREQADLAMNLLGNRSKSTFIIL